ncbi:Uncharacterised protein [Bordetella pertussis]|nr:Uncharacterised protein [Bordetella pertussis]
MAVSLARMLFSSAVSWSFAFRSAMRCSKATSFWRSLVILPVVSSSARSTASRSRACSNSRTPAATDPATAADRFSYCLLIAAIDAASSVAVTVPPPARMRRMRSSFSSRALARFSSLEAPCAISLFSSSRAAIPTALRCASSACAFAMADWVCI